MTDVSTTTIPVTFEGREKIIEEGQLTFIRVGLCIAAIKRDKQHIEAGYDNFESYCQERWGWSRQRAFQYEKSAALIDEMVSDGVKDLPANERQARELSNVDREDRGKVMEDAKKQAESEGRSPTSNDIRAAAQPGEVVGEQLVDDGGLSVPDHLAKIFGPQRDRLDDLIERQKSIRREIAALEKKPVAAWNNPGSGVRRQVDAALKHMQSIRPTLVCRACYGDGDGCNACHGRGFVSAHQKDHHLKRYE